MLFLVVIAVLMTATSGRDIPITMTRHWSGGFQGEFCIPFTIDVTSWRANLTFTEPLNKLEVWVAEIESQSPDGTQYTLVNKPFNGVEHGGDNLCVTFLGHGNGDIDPTAILSIDLPEPTTTTSTTTTTTTTTPTTTRTLGPGESMMAAKTYTGETHRLSSSGKVWKDRPFRFPAGNSGKDDISKPFQDLKDAWPPTTTPLPTTSGMPPIHVPHNRTASFELMQHHGEQWEGRFCFDLKEEIVAWELIMDFNVDVKDITNYEGDFKTPTTSCTKHLVLVNRKSKGVHYAGEHYCVRMMGHLCDPSKDPDGKAVLVDVTNDGQTLPRLPVVTGAQATKYNYAEILMKSILFYEAQRSGKLPPDNRIPWRADSALNDKGENGEDLTGGWYDAGDNVKFNYPMAFSTTLLTWSLIKYKDAYEKTGQLGKMYECIKWPLDYFIKCHTKPNELYGQVGDGGKDHGSWTSPERMTGSRPASKIDASNPGSDLAMETASAMAAGSVAFKDKDPAYSATLLKHAEQLFAFGKAHQGKYSQSIRGAQGFYTSQDYEDENSWGGMWLYKATGDKKYLDFAEEHFVNKTAWGFSWDEKIGGANLLLYEATMKDIYKQPIELTFKDWFPGGTIPYSPKCMAFRLEWGALRYAANTAFLALVAADDGINPEKNRKWAMTQLHYAFGDAGRSFIVGFGVNPPERPHHRASSCPMLPAPCDWEAQTQKGPNPHTLYGAMVGGPGKDDSYVDDRKDYTKNEVACDYNAGMHASTAALEHLALTHNLPTTYKELCP